MVIYLGSHFIKTQYSYFPVQHVFSIFDQHKESKTAKIILYIYIVHLVKPVCLAICIAQKSLE